MAQPRKMKSSLNPNAQPHLQGSDRFRIEREIADTLQGRIYAGTDLMTNKEVVIKEAWKQLVHTGRSRKGHRVPENFLHEREMIMLLSKLPDSHPGIVRGIDEWNDDHCYYYAMEYCNGELFDYISKNHTSTAYRQFIDGEAQKKQVPMERANEWVKCVAKMFKQICQTVQWMHHKGFCHLDMSLENTMLSDLNTLQVKIIDFGLAQKFNPNNFRFQGRVGKLQYMCPEAYARKPYDARAADIYTLGIMLFMMLIGAPPYQAPQPQNAAFNYFISGRIGDVLKHWKRLRLVTVDALDLLTKIIRYENSRISINEILNHPFITSIDNENQTNNDDDNSNQMKTEYEQKTNTLSPVDVITEEISGMSIDDENTTNSSSPKQQNQQQQKPNISNTIHSHGRNNPHNPNNPSSQRQPPQPKFNPYANPYSPQQQQQQQQNNAYYYQQQQGQQQQHQHQHHDHMHEDEEQDIDIEPNDNNNNSSNVNNESNMFCDLLLTEWNLQHCSSLLQSQGWGSPKDWHQLTVFVLVHEVGFTQSDAKKFIYCMQQYSHNQQSQSQSNNNTTNHYNSNDPNNKPN